MSMIKAGEVAFLKTTGEAVYVYTVGDDVQVHRPVAGQDGIRHSVEMFQLGELESLDEQRKRYISERQEVLSKYGAQVQGGQTPADPNVGFGSN